MKPLDAPGKLQWLTGQRWHMWARGSSSSRFDPLRLLEVPRSPLIAGPVTFLVVLFATVVKLIISTYEPKALVFATYFPALAVAALMFGRLWGYAAVALSAAIAAYAFMEPYNVFAFGSTTSLVNVTLFAVSGSTLVEICGAYRRALARIQTKRELLAQENARTELLARELQHRTKNAAAVIASIVRQSLRSDADMANKILGRINAMYSADLLDRTPGGLCELDQVVAQEVASVDAQRVSMAGPQVEITSELARSLAMIFHELLTNASKYGALSTPGGHVAISWQREGSKVAMRWEETGGPVLSGAPASMGFGSFLIERLLGERDGTLRQNFESSGLTCHMTFLVERQRSEEAA